MLSLILFGTQQLSDMFKYHLETMKYNHTKTEMGVGGGEKERERERERERLKGRQTEN